LDALIIVLALVIDWLVGEPKKWHPLVGFGRAASFIEQKRPFGGNRWAGFLSWTLLLGLPLTIAWLLRDYPIFQLLGLYLAIGHKSLHQHALRVLDALNQDDLVEAKVKLSHLVSRDTHHLNSNGVSKATIESVLENGSDSTIAALFWFSLAGLPGVIGYRLMNTLDAMWGYKTQRFSEFGFFAARADDLVNWPAARLTSIAYALLGNFHDALHCWRNQAAFYSSPNAGPVMAAGAGALGVCLGGPYSHGGEIQVRPVLGCGAEATAADIQRALNLLLHSTIMVAVFLALCSSVF